jgi:DNA-binding transcriptional LysR family regulator
MDHFVAIKSFVAVAEAQSFSEAARRLRMTKSAVSRQVGELERELGARLLHRTTRSLSLTDAGHSYFERVSRILVDLDEAHRAIGELRTAPRGKLRVSAPMSFGSLHLMPAVSDFLAAYPDVIIDLALTDRFDDLVDDGFDVAVRVATPSVSTLASRTLASARRVICASPKYFSSHGALATPDDLKAHVCLFYSNLTPTRDWRFVTSDGAPWHVTVHGRLSANNGEALRIAALRGLGLVSLPTFIVGPDLKAGRLVSVLEAYIAQDLTISAVYPHSRHVAPAVPAFISFLADRFAPESSWDLVQDGLIDSDGAAREQSEDADGVGIGACGTGDDADGLDPRVQALRSEVNFETDERDPSS